MKIILTVLFVLFCTDIYSQNEIYYKICPEVINDINDADTIKITLVNNSFDTLVTVLEPFTCDIIFKSDRFSANILSYHPPFIEFSNYTNPDKELDAKMEFIYSKFPAFAIINPKDSIILFVCISDINKDIFQNNIWFLHPEILYSPKFKIDETIMNKFNNLIEEYKQSLTIEKVFYINLIQNPEYNEDIFSSDIKNINELLRNLNYSFYQFLN